jgi:hypothetical protein
MLEHTHIPEAPWWVVEAVDKKRVRLNCINHLLTQVPYQEVDRDSVDRRDVHLFGNGPAIVVPIANARGQVDSTSDTSKF